MIGDELMNFDPTHQCLIALRSPVTNKSFINKVDECGVIVFAKGMDHLLVVLQNLSRKWGFPKGHMTHIEQYNKEYFKCAKRELLEETGIDLRVVSHTKYGTLILGNKLFYIVEIKAPNVRTRVIDRHEISETRWIRRTDLFTFVEKNTCNATLNKLF